MIAPRINRFAAILGFCGACWILSGGALGQAAQGYSDFRQSLVADGWKPDVRHGLKTASGKPLYRFPEVVCGPALCSAKWRDRQGHEKLITLMRGLDGADHRVAPQ